MNATQRVRLTAIAPEAYRHPLDQKAASALRAVPGFERAVAWFSAQSIERYLFHETCASSVRVTPKQCGAIHRLLTEACDTLDLDVPNLFLSQTPIANAFAFGQAQPTLVLHTGLVELLDDNELRGVIAHELGHVHCGHSTLRLMGLLLVMAGRLGGMRLGAPDLLTVPLQAALLDWMRNAEYSADRAAVLGTQDPEVVFSALFKLTGGSPKVFAQMDRDEYLRQAADYAPGNESRIDKVFKTLIETEKTHPIPVLRARAVLEWGQSDQYRDIIAGRYQRRGETPGTAVDRRRCTACGEWTPVSFSFCTRCGHANEAGDIDSRNQGDPVSQTGDTANYAEVGTGDEGTDA